MSRAASATRPTIAPTGAALGAEVRGVDLSGVSSQLREVLLEAWVEHLVLLFRNQELTEDEHLCAARQFGPLQTSAVKSHYASSGERELLTAESSEISVVHNLGPTGEPISAEVPWHSDNSYVEAPPAGTMLYARVIPPGGGRTCFSNQYLAYETLSEEVRREIDGRTAVHDSSAGFRRPGEASPARPADVPGPHHHLVRTHPLSMRRALYLGRRRPYPSQHIDGLSKADSEELLELLWEHACRPELVWCHAWRPGDVLLWDNRCTLHRREALATASARILHRTLIAGEVPG